MTQQLLLPQLGVSLQPYPPHVFEVDVPTGCWRLYGGAWQLLAVMQRAAEGLASLSPPATPRAAHHPEAPPATPPSSTCCSFDVVNICLWFV